MSTELPHSQAPDPTDPNTWPVVECESTDVFLGSFAQDFSEVATDEQRSWPLVECEPIDMVVGGEPVQVIPSSLVRRYDAWAEPEVSWGGTLARGSSSSSAEPADDVRRAVVWGLGDTPGAKVDDEVGMSVALPQNLAVRCYADPSESRIAVKLVLVPTEGGDWSGVLRVFPPPTRETMTIVLTFPSGLSQSFLVPASPPERDDREAVSSPSVSLPASELPDPSSGWRGAIEFG